MYVRYDGENLLAENVGCYWMYRLHAESILAGDGRDGRSGILMEECYGAQVLLDACASAAVAACYGEYGLHE